ncbi:hypothetical protein [Planococcus koreensis]|uniref:hypothetical protein n=1 Tax=Planococcus koreensis TaxID=112331 RepID=UPI0039FDE11A
MGENRENAGNGRNKRRETTKQRSSSNDGREKRRASGIDYDQIFVDAAHYLQVYDPHLILSWTPREFKNFIKGARLRQIDGYEQSAANALFTAKAQNSRKRIGLKNLYDAEKARKEMDSAAGIKEEPRDLTLYRKAQAAMKTWSSDSLQKGG